MCTHISRVENSAQVFVHQKLGKNGQPPKSQFAKRSTCQKVDLPKRKPKHDQKTLTHVFGMLTFCQVDILSS